AGQAPRRPAVRAAVRPPAPHDGREAALRHADRRQRQGRVGGAAAGGPQEGGGDPQGAGAVPASRLPEVLPEGERRQAGQVPGPRIGPTGEPRETVSGTPPLRSGAVGGQLFPAHLLAQIKTARRLAGGGIAFFRQVGLTANRELVLTPPFPLQATAYR